MVVVYRVKSFPLRIGARLCCHCGWLFLAPTYDDAELEKLYAADDSHLSSDCAAAVEMDQRRCLVIRRTLEPWLPAGHLRLLDVGGGSGELVQCFSADGHEVTVVDMSNTPAGKPDMAKVSIPFLEWSGNEFDVVIMSHVLEHTASPSGFLGHASTFRCVLSCQAAVLCFINHKDRISRIRQESGRAGYRCNRPFRVGIRWRFASPQI